MNETCIEFPIYRENEDEDEDEIVLDIRGSAEPYVPAKLSGHPDNCTPPEGGCAGVNRILLNGKPWDGTLTADEKEDAEHALMDKYEEDVSSAAEAAAIAKYESMMDDYVYDDMFDDNSYGPYGPDIYDF
ncbi:hypothetical protein LCGC14_0702000 [marine sediment metagenome]|uniref:Uncharacterized protein n=1 Tax=marine sediment metagenome TaxID=412755 RepID=A0A0F9TQ95_9ZZZZ